MIVGGGGRGALLASNKDVRICIIIKKRGYDKFQRGTWNERRKVVQLLICKIRRGRKGIFTGNR